MPRAVVSWVAVISLLGCVPGKPRWLVAPYSSAPTPPTREAVLHAGIGRADITPYPGLGLAGNGPEGKRAVGYRTRLYARAILLQDPAGERVALVVADLPHISILLHREVAARVRRAIGMGVDRLILSATHTHSGPGHFYETHQLNGITSRVPGYDTTVVRFLADAIAQAVTDAANDLHPARLAWRAMPVWGHTRNRMYDAFRRNAPLESPFGPAPSDLDPARKSVNPLWTMLRIEVRDTNSPREGPFRPAAAYSVFALHGTGNTSENELYDGDIHALVERGLERHIDSLRRAGGDNLGRSVHVFANGTEGDVSPDWPAQTRCPLPLLRPLRRPAGPRTPENWGWQHASPAAIGRCEAAARAYVNAVGDTLARRAAALFDTLARGSMSDTVRIGVAFRTLALADSHEVLGVCPSPQIGTSTAAGADDGVTRYRGFRLFGLFPLGLEQGKSAVRGDPKGCHAEKRTTLSALTAKHAFPEHAQVSVVRIGDLLLGALPGEPTTMVGVAVSDSMLAAAATGGASGLQRSDPEPYQRLRQLRHDGGGVHGADIRRRVDDLRTQRSRHVRPRARTADRLAGPEGAEPARARRTTRCWCIPARSKPWCRRRRPWRSSVAFWSFTARADTTVARWVDLHPSRFTPSAGLVLEWQRRVNGRWTPAAVDDDPHVEVRFTGGKRHGGWVWESRWTPRGVPGPYRFVLLPRLEMGEVAGECDPAAAES